MEKVVDLDSHREDEIANEDELDDELFDALSDLSIKMCEPTEELFEDEEETIMENEKAKTSMAENLEKIFDGFTSKINSEEFSEKLADSLYLNLFGQKSFDKMKDKQAKKKVKAEDREARKETGEATFTEKISDKFTDFLKFHPRKAGTIIVGCTAIFVMGVGYSLSRR
jgi:hypothetical protein